MQGLRRGPPSYGSLVAYSARQTNDATTTSTPSTIITIEANESTPLLADRWQNCSHYNNKNNCHQPVSEAALNGVGVGDTADSTYHHSSSKNSWNSYNQPKLQLCELRVIGIVFILVAGLFIATYLLVTESRLPSMGFALDLVNHDIWSKLALPIGGLLNHTQVGNIMIMQTGGRHCQDPDDCLIALKEMQAQIGKDTELPYNFLIGGDGQTYEVRGWDYESGLGSIPQNTSLVVGFIGNYTKIAPSCVQLQSALSLIKESNRRRKLQKPYQVYGLSSSPTGEDGTALFQKIQSKWPRFDGVLRI